MYEMTSNGYTFLVYGFTAKKAGKFKEKCTESFNAIEDNLLEKPQAFNLNKLSRMDIHKKDLESEQEGLMLNLKIYEML